MAIKRKINSYNAALGMRVYHERTINRNTMTIVHHIEMSMPGYKLTENGPELVDIKNLELDDDKK